MYIKHTHKNKIYIIAILYVVENAGNVKMYLNTVYGFSEDISDKTADFIIIYTTTMVAIVYNNITVKLF